MAGELSERGVDGPLSKANEVFDEGGLFEARFVLTEGEGVVTAAAAEAVGYADRTFSSTPSKHSFAHSLSLRNSVLQHLRLLLYQRLPKFTFNPPKTVKGAPGETKVVLRTG